jgi:UDP-N-acetylmuramoylalanine--D-glutamate ligase
VRDGVRFFNDSKATTPEAATAGVTAFPPGAVIPIFGGSDKGVAFQGLATAIADYVTWAALIGVTAPVIAEALNNAGIATETFRTLEDAVTACAGRAHSGDTVLLSPGCASYDMFNDYRERGEVFSRAARALGAV